jgi:HSP20 family protein
LIQIKRVPRPEGSLSTTRLEEGVPRERRPLVRHERKGETMADIMRYDPFSDIDELFKGFFVRPMRFDLAGTQPMRMRVDVTRSNDAYTVKAEMPGVKKEDIEISIDGNEVTISGEIKKEAEEKKGEEVVRSERYYGKISRSFTLAHEVDEAKASAKYTDGVLKLTLPLKAKSATKKIAVS